VIDSQQASQSRCSLSGASPWRDAQLRCVGRDIPAPSQLEAIPSSVLGDTVLCCAERVACMHATHQTPPIRWIHPPISVDIHGYCIQHRYSQIAHHMSGEKFQQADGARARVRAHTRTVPVYSCIASSLATCSRERERERELEGDADPSGRIARL
jgi:hypothetical protein